MNNYWKEWLKCAGMRALKTFAQAALATLGTSAIKITDVDLLGVFLIGLTAAVGSFLCSLAGLPELNEPKHPNQKEEQQV